MKCKGSFVFKSISHRDAGVFKNDKGEDVKYPSAYILKVDEINAVSYTHLTLPTNSLV